MICDQDVRRKGEGLGGMHQMGESTFFKVLCEPDMSASHKPAVDKGESWQMGSVSSCAWPSPFATSPRMCLLEAILTFRLALGSEHPIRFLTKSRNSPLLGWDTGKEQLLQLAAFAPLCNRDSSAGMNADVGPETSRWGVCLGRSVEVPDGERLLQRLLTPRPCRPR